MKNLIFIRGLAVFISLYAAFVMVGWIWNIPAFTGLLFNEINMKFSSALIFFLSGIALYFIAESFHNKKDWAQIVLPPITLITFLIMATLLVAGIFKVQTGIESLFITDANPNFKTVTPGMPALPTMINFIVFGIANIMGLFTLPCMKKTVFLLGFFMSLSSLLAVLGYVLNFPPFYYKFDDLSTPMALNTAIVFILLGAGLILIGREKSNLITA